jgi:hypothetical protein
MAIHQLSYRLKVAVAVFALAGMGPAGAAVQDSQDDPTGNPQANPRWLDRLEKLDRALLDANIGFAPPAIDNEMSQALTWVGMEPATWESLRGRVIVLQSWTSRSEAGRSAPARAQKSLEGIDPASLLLIAIHTPEGADTAETFLERRPLDVPVIIDRKGALLDELGIFKRPANVVIDRNGTVRFAGLNAQGLTEAVKLLVAESFDEAKNPAPREQEAEVQSTAVAFPTDMGTGGSARNIRGQRAPDFHVQQWLSDQPDAAGKVVMVEFWATW